MAACLPASDVFCASRPQEPEFYRQHIGGDSGPSSKLLKTKKQTDARHKLGQSLETHLVLGQRIRHPTHGMGTITAVKPGAWRTVGVGPM